MLQAHLAAHPLQHRQQHIVDEQDRVASVVHDIGQILSRQARVQRVQHPTHQRHAKVCLQVMGVVPAKRRHTITAADAEPGHRAGELVGPASHVGIGGAGERPIRPAAHHLNIGEVARRPVQQERHSKRVIHHQAVHRTSSAPGIGGRHCARRRPAPERCSPTVDGAQTSQSAAPPTPPSSADAPNRRRGERPHTRHVPQHARGGPTLSRGALGDRLQAQLAAAQIMSSCGPLGGRFMGRAGGSRSVI